MARCSGSGIQNTDPDSVIHFPEHWIKILKIPNSGFLDPDLTIKLQIIREKKPGVESVNYRYTHIWKKMGFNSVHLYSARKTYLEILFWHAKRRG